MAVLGGEIWLVIGGTIRGALPRREGKLPGVYSWESKRSPEETWDAFVERSAFETLEAVKRMPPVDETAIPEGGAIYYNLTWVSEAEN